MILMLGVAFSANAALYGYNIDKNQNTYAGAFKKYTGNDFSGYYYLDTIDSNIGQISAMSHFASRNDFAAKTAFAARIARVEPTPEPTPEQVHEPATMMLIGAGLVGLAVLGRKRGGGQQVKSFGVALLC